MTADPQEDPLVHVLLEETLGTARAPDLRQRVLARAAEPGHRQPGAPPRRRWVAAAALVMGVAAVGYTAWVLREPARSTRTAPAEGGQLQDPTVVRPKTLEEFKALLPRVKSLRVHTQEAPPHSATVAGAPPTVYTKASVVAEVVGALGQCGPAGPPAGWKWPNTIELVLENGDMVVCSLSIHDAFVGVHGIPDLTASQEVLAPIRHVVEWAAWEARRHQGVVYDPSEFALGTEDPIPRDSERLQLWGFENRDLAGISWFHKVRVLELGHSSRKLSDAGMAHVAKLATLEELDFPGAGITDRGLAWLAALPRLHTLKLRSAPATAVADEVPFLSDLPLLADLFKNSKSLSGVGFAAFAEHPSLRFVVLSYNSSLTDEGMKHLAAIPKLEALDLSGRRLGNVTAAGLQQLSLATGLRTLDLSDCPLDLDAGLDGFEKLLALESLDLSDTSVSSEGLRHLVLCDRLAALDLSRCAKLDGTALALLATLRGLTHLEASRLPLRDAELTHLGRMKLLRALDIDQTPITEAVAIAIARCRDLEQLSLSFCNVTDECLAHLATLPNLAELDLAGNDDITDDGLARLGAAQSLRRIDLNVCDGITKAGVSALREALPTADLVLPNRLR